MSRPSFTRTAVVARRVRALGLEKLGRWVTDLPGSRIGFHRFRVSRRLGDFRCLPSTTPFVTRPSPIRRSSGRRGCNVCSARPVLRMVAFPYLAYDTNRCCRRTGFVGYRRGQAGMAGEATRWHAIFALAHQCRRPVVPVRGRLVAKPGQSEQCCAEVGQVRLSVQYPTQLSRLGREFACCGE